MTLSRFVYPLLMGGAAALSGCYVRAQPEPVYATTEITSAPVGIETYPYVVYEGRPVYWYQDHWYYRNGNHWGYYRQEPPQLYRQRPYVQSAPPAPRRYTPAHPVPGRAPVGAPPARRYP